MEVVRRGKLFNTDEAKAFLGWVACCTSALGKPADVRQSHVILEAPGANDNTLNEASQQLLGTPCPWIAAVSDGRMKDEGVERVGWCCGKFCERTNSQGGCCFLNL